MGEGPGGDPVIVFNCPSCGQMIKVPRAAAGKRGKCNQCGATVTIPDGLPDTPFQPFAELEGSVQFEQPPPQNNAEPQAGLSASGLVSLTPVVNQEADDDADEVPPEEIIMDPDPPEPVDAIEDLAVATAGDKPARKAARQRPWSVGKVVALVLFGPLIFGIGYEISHIYSLHRNQKAQLEAAAGNGDSRSASPVASGKTTSTPAASLTPGDKEALQSKLAETMAKAQKIAGLAQNGHLSVDDRNELDLEVKEVLRLRGELDLPNWLIRQPDFGNEYSNDLAPWNELQMILHPEKYPGCQVRVMKIKAPG